MGKGERDTDYGLDFSEEIVHGGVYNPAMGVARISSWVNFFPQKVDDLM